MNKEEAKTKLCVLRDIFKIIKDFETEFQNKHDICLNEGMTLCTLKKEKKLSSSDLAESLGLSNSNMSKVIKSIEGKGYINRILGDEDKRQMYFELSPSGEDKLNQLKCEEQILDSILSSIYATKGTKLIGLP